MHFMLVWISPVYSETSSLISTLLIFLAERYANRKKLRAISKAGIINVIKVILLSTLVTPTILSRVSSSGFDRNKENTPPKTEPITAIIKIFYCF